jgi:hypothetical protein
LVEHKSIEFHTHAVLHTEPCTGTSKGHSHFRRDFACTGVRFS